jgi:GNAT superfamily N-acetyltransferase
MVGMELASIVAMDRVAPDDEATLRELFAFDSAVRALDRPADPPLCWVAYRVHLAVPWPGERTTVWVARSGGAVVGRATLSLPTLDNLSNGVADVVVAPGHRRAGFGRALLAHVGAEARRAGRSRLMAELREPLDGGSPARAFATAAGATPALAELRRRLPLPPDEAALARLRAEALAAARGYDLVQWTGPTPAEWLDDIAELTGRMSTDAPLDDLHLDPEHYDARRIRERDAARVARGGRTVVTAAREVATGRLVAFTDLVVRATVPHHGGQMDTIVAPAHRGHRLGLLVKIANLDLARREHPALQMIDTWNADSNPYMVSINEAMGFRPLDRWVEWELEL